MSLRTLIESGQRMGCTPWPRFLLDQRRWADLAPVPGFALLGLWGEPGFAHAAFLDETRLEVLLASVPAEEGRIPALSPRWPSAALFERMLRDLWGIEAEGGTDARPFLDHGRWPLLAPLSARPVAQAPEAKPMEFLPVAGEGVHIIPVGPIHAGVIEPGHFRFHVQGEIIVRLEARLGYVHKGTLSLMQGKPPRAAARFAARLSGDTTVAHSLAFARAAEAALEVEAPPRAQALRAAMLELERLHNHLNDLGFIANDAAFAVIHARCGWLREGLLRAQRDAFGHRLMMDRVLPGGVAQDVAPDGVAALLAALSAIEAELPAILALYEGHASLQDRVLGTGIMEPWLVAAFAPGGVVGRAAGRGFDARLLTGELAPEALVTQSGADVDARWRQRYAEVLQSLAFLRELLPSLPEGELTVQLPPRGGEGIALVEGFRGECLAWMRLDGGGGIEACMLRDPSWLHWPLLEAAVIGNIVADFPLINKSINGSYSGVDL
ncbi:NADH-quinone oxidoreductase subunit C [Roseococcus sp. SDR]|uniref:hydrogenase large subunit n=1 Tax=Roseococcus sp. SDR TaxID=2835532 RepID=UPI001BCCF622|nr:nickel-dependent hydrogenase large subunit [Roseococcus sp. SDR]MBS7788782.1 NADH-quinone oxidoreductase subunit C [Roseococcus sp. SDR]MBV1844096.1 NADH-quinone oxidoreductase subunit C [Roseococcus sp. SDR]